MTWDGFQELTADRKAKGFNVGADAFADPIPTKGFSNREWRMRAGFLTNP